MPTTRPRASAVLRGIGNDPVRFCRDVLGFEPWSKQREVLESVRDHRRTAVRSAHGVGKTATAARCVLWFLAAFPRSTVICTAPTQHQLRDVLWREVAAAVHAAEGFLDGELTESRFEIARDWFAVALSTDRAERFQGFHAEHLLLVVDEASGVHEELFTAAEGFLTAPGAKVLLIGNPTRLSGSFYSAFHSNRSAWNTVSISALDTPVFTGETVPDEVSRRLPSPEWVEGAKAKWGEASPLYQVRVLGEFPSSADDTVVALAEVEAAQARSVEPGIPVIVSVDVARFGSDETVIALRRGEHVRIAKTYAGRDLMATVGEILRVAREIQKETSVTPLIVVDDAGVGGGVVDRLREVGDFSVRSFLGASSARDPREHPNRRSEGWFDFAEQLPDIDLDPDEQLAADLVAPSYAIDSGGRRVVEAKSETKRRLGRSPDRADSVLMAFAERPGSPDGAHVGVVGASLLDGTARDGSGRLEPSIRFDMMF